MYSLVQGSVRVKASELNLDLTLLGGQSFRWQKRVQKEEIQWLGVAYGTYWILTQDENNLFYQAFTASGASHPIKNQKYFNELLQRYFRLDFDLPEQVKQWRTSHTHFDNLAPYMKAVRVLNQEPLENILSFICSQNNNIKRISTMIQWLCTNYGEKIGNFDSHDVYDFPKLESFLKIQDKGRHLFNMKSACTVSTILDDVLNAIERFICPQWVQLEMETTEKHKSRDCFYNKYKIPSIVGCIDGTHVKIIKPTCNEHLFYNRKGYFSMNTMILEERLRGAKFGYRAKFISQSVAKINAFGGLSWFEKLRSLPYQDARQELVKLPGIGLKVADCICLMSLGHLESVPIDTHIFKIAQTVYMPQLAGAKAVTPKIYEEIAENFRKIYGPLAGWAQAALFCSELQQFQTDTAEDKTTSLSHSKKKRKN